MKGLLAGVGLGFGVGLLLAPHAGSETRRRVKGKVEEITGRLSESAHALVSPKPDQDEQLGETQAEHGIQVDSGTGDEAADNIKVLEFLNTASKTKLMSISGIGDATARRIMESREYASAEIVVAEGILSEQLMTKLRKTVLSNEEEKEQAA